MPTITIHGIPSSYTGDGKSLHTPTKIAEEVKKRAVDIGLSRDTTVSILLNHANQGRPIPGIIIAINLLPEDDVHSVTFWHDISSRCSGVMREFFKLTPIQCIVGVTTNTVVHYNTHSIEPYEGSEPCPECGQPLKLKGRSWDCPNCGYIHLSPP